MRFPIQEATTMTKQLKRSGSLRRVREGRDVRCAFGEEGFGKYYLLALTNDMYERLSGYELDEGEYRIGDEVDVPTDTEEVTIAGTIVGFAIAKPAFFWELADVNLDCLNIVETEEGIQFGEIVGMSSDFYPASIQDVEDALGIA